MKLTFIGVGSALSRKHGNSSLLIEQDGRRLVIDCGRTVPEGLLELGLKWHDIDAVYISHPHGDHAGGIEDFAFTRMFVPPISRPKLFGKAEMLHDLWTHTLAGGMGAGPVRPKALEDFFDVHYVEHDFEWQGIRFELVKMKHLMPSYGLRFISPKGRRVFYSTDACLPVPLSAAYLESDLIFHDCEITPYQSGVHAHYEDLRKLPAGVRRKMYLYHYQDLPLPAAADDGFAGFVVKGQAFDL